MDDFLLSLNPGQEALLRAARGEMNEQDWLASEDPQAMLALLDGDVLKPLHGWRPSERKLRLFACACARLALGATIHSHEMAGIQAAEDYSDGAIPAATMLAFRGDWHEPYCPWWLACLAEKRRLAREIQWAAGCDPRGLAPGLLSAALRHIVGNPFRPAALDRDRLRPDCWDDAWPDLAQRAYEDRDWGLLPILADALLDAGCEDERILSHLRSPGPHARGCWALDLVLGKE